MFSVNQKRYISDQIQKILRSTNHPELPENEIEFEIHIKGKEDWSWAIIKNNKRVVNPKINPHNERMDKSSIKGNE